jgi:hypothetical protein
MPDLSFTISGAESNQFIEDWAVYSGYSLQIEDPENPGQLINNPQPLSEFIINTIFIQAKAAVFEKRKRDALMTIKESETVAIQDILDGLDPIVMQM